MISLALNILAFLFLAYIGILILGGVGVLIGTIFEALTGKYDGMYDSPKEDPFSQKKIEELIKEQKKKNLINDSL